MEYLTPKFWQMTIGFLIIVGVALGVTLYVGHNSNNTQVVSN